MIETGTATAGNQSRPDAAQEQEDHRHHQADRDKKGVLHVSDRSTDGDGAVGDDRDLDGGRIDASICGNAALIAFTVAMTLALGSRWIASTMPRCWLTQPRRVTSCGPTIALPTSETRIGPPLR